jgi:acyl-[acyl carrier protein]--UDP-N-acetylglucosamine O-acyltransferase
MITNMNVSSNTNIICENIMITNNTVIDSYSMVGGASLILKDVPAYVMASGNPAHAFGINIDHQYERVQQHQHYLRKYYDHQQYSHVQYAY